jgi:nucleoside-diphosphate-sugar epimerase
VILNIGTGVATRLRDVIRTLTEKCGRPATDIEFSAIPYRPNEVGRFVADANAAQAQLGWRPSVHLQAGLMDLVASHAAEIA